MRVHDDSIRSSRAPRSDEETTINDHANRRERAEKRSRSVEQGDSLAGRLPGRNAKEIKNTSGGLRRLRVNAYALIRTKDGREEQLWEELERENFSGPLYDAVIVELVGYAKDLIANSIRSRLIFRIVRDLGRPVGIYRADLDKAAVETLTSHTLAAAVRMFEKRARAGKGWAPQRIEKDRTTLATYFLGAAHLSFSGEFRRWAKDFPIESYVRSDEDADDVHEDEYFTDVRCTDEEVEEIIAKYFIRHSAGNAEIVRLKLEGYSPAEIAAQLEISEGAVRNRWDRIARHIRQNFDFRGRRNKG